MASLYSISGTGVMDESVKLQMVHGIQVIRGTPRGPLIESTCAVLGESSSPCSTLVQGGIGEKAIRR